MLSKAQSKRFVPQPSLNQQHALSSLEKGLLRWSMAERGDKVLDVHVGSGLMLEYLQRNMECEVCGISDDMESVRASRSRLRNADIIYASLEEIPWRANTFDSVYVKVITTSLNEQMLRECIRVLKPGGQLLIGFVSIPSVIRPFMGLIKPETEEMAIHARSQGGTQAILKALGLTQITMQRAAMVIRICIGWKPMQQHEEA